MSLRKYITAEEFATVYKISKPNAWAIFKRLQTGGPPGIVVKIGRHVRADEELLAQWMAKGGELSGVG